MALLSYLLPPTEVYGNLFSLSPTRNQALFIGVATGVLFIEFTLARHLFCRYGCAGGDVSKSGLDGQSPGDGGGLLAGARPRLRRLSVVLRPRLPDATQATQHQAPDVCLHPMRPVHRRLQHRATPQP
ncbi:MAG: hypothetical protein R3F44_07065 [Candidatus Competibacteraceae bacterium]